MKTKTSNLLAPSFRSILDQAQAFVIAHPQSLSAFNMCPWGIEIPPQNIFSSIHSSSAAILQQISHMDRLSFGPSNMSMPKWALFDCSAMPGGIFGFGLPRNSPLWQDPHLQQDKVQEYLRTVPSSLHIIPISMYMALPLPVLSFSQQQQQWWFGHNLSSLAAILQLPLEGLGLLTKATSIKVFNSYSLMGACQWTGPAINLHLKLSPLTIESCYTPAHSYPHTLVYRSQHTDETLLEALATAQFRREVKQWDLLFPRKDVAFAQALQEQEIEQENRQFQVLGHVIVRDGQEFYPLGHVNLD